MKYSIYALLALFLINIGCRKKDDPVTQTPVTTIPQINIIFKNTVDNKPLGLNNTKYQNANGDTFTVSSYQYYISNISLFKDDGSEYKESDSYHLINESSATSKQLTIKNIPTGDYVKIRFLIGVDSLRNVSGAQTGALDPINGMFWTWNTGYIMARMEGSSPQAGIYPNNLGFHIGGFEGPNNVLRWVTLQLPSKAIVTNSNNTSIYINSNLAEWFKTPLTINFSNISSITSSSYGAKMIADNYADMFSIDHVE
ncbi:MAG: hypothetical protein JST82_16545 [Bacteroidetes bacterium]|nr:hypothetical protein [Bacteroidota bacterium]